MLSSVCLALILVWLGANPLAVGVLSAKEYFPCCAAAHLLGLDFVVYGNRCCWLQLWRLGLDFAVYGNRCCWLQMWSPEFLPRALLKACTVVAARRLNLLFTRVGNLPVGLFSYLEIQPLHVCCKVLGLLELTV